MRKFIFALCLVGFIKNGISQTTHPKWSGFKRSVAIFFRGFSSPVFRTDADLSVIGVNDSKTYTISSGLVYRKVNEEDGYIYLKAIKSVTTSNFKVSILNSDKDTETSSALYKVKTTDLKSYNKIWQQGLSWSVLILPIKYRPAVNFNGTKFEKVFSTDVSIGPFIGYKIKIGKFYNQFFQIGGFAGPTLIQFPNTVIPNNGQASQNNITNDNIFGFTYGWGAVFQYDKLQIGLINGADQLGGEKSKQWQYDGKSWWSFAIGYKFLGE